MIISDNETKIDLLNNEAIAKTIISVMDECQDKPVSIGIHGDWGAGKSSILEMIEYRLEKENEGEKLKYCCIRFNGWKHQGFEDSKVVLMSTIVSELTEKEKLQEKAKDVLKKIWKNINWMSAAKMAGKTAIGLATGTTPIVLLSSALEALQGKARTTEGIESAVESISGFLKDSKISEDTSSNTEFTEFQKNFEELLDKANIKKLVILIDDLDRCLPDVAINTLEAIRLFMFIKKTAFVIAADENMIRYAVKKHFPDMVDENQYNLGSGFSNKYLEKLIQVPFRIPALGEVEACNYIMLLLIESVLGDDNPNYRKICTDGLSRIQKPWDVKCFTIPDVQALLSSDYDKVSNEVLIATEIGHLLSRNTNGNPRKIKRFINMLLLRYEIAKNRGFGENITLPILAKMMLIEYYEPTFYKELPSHLNETGVWKEAGEVKSTIQKAISEGAELKIDNRWFEPNSIKDWIITEPSIADIDLRPYYYACKEKIDYFAGRAEASDLAEIVNILFKQEVVILQYKERIENLTEPEAGQIFDIVCQKIVEKGDFKKKPDGIDGLIVLTKLKNYLRKKLASFIATLPKAEVGVWVLTGWDQAIPKDSTERCVLDEFYKQLETEGNSLVQKFFKKTGDK